MKFSGKMSLMIILSLKNTFLEKPQGGGQIEPLLPIRFRVKISKSYSHFASSVLYDLLQKIF